MPELTETGGRMLNANLYEENRERCAAPESSETGVSEEGEGKTAVKATESASPLRRRKFHAPDSNFFSPVTHSKEYLDYLVSEHWANLRLSAFNRANRKCEVCATIGGLNGHHLIYRRPLTDGVLDDIMVLCERCHDLWHDWMRQTQNRLKTFTREATRGAILVLLSAPAPVKRVDETRLTPGQQLQAVLLGDPRFTDAIARLDRGKFKKWLRGWAAQNTRIASRNRIMVNGLILHKEYRPQRSVDLRPEPKPFLNKFDHRVINRGTNALATAAATRQVRLAKAAARRKLKPHQLRPDQLHGPAPETRAWFPDGKTSLFA